MKNFYITTAIDYVNGAPHQGHVYEKIIADAVARFQRIRGYDVFFMTGTDDNAAKNEEAAIKAGVPVREFVDRNAQHFVDLCRTIGLSEDYFIRTVDPAHVKVAQDVFQIVFDKGEIYKGEYEGLYCSGCEAFYVERDLSDGKCPEHDREPTVVKEESYFFKLSKYKSRIIQLIEDGFIIPHEKATEILARLRNEELQDLSVSRIHKHWGIPTPIDPKHTIYVWFDALLNYYSGVHTKERMKYWPCDVHLIGKGINWFHSVIWPAMLMSADISLPKHIAVHGYITVNGKKIGKSLGNAGDPKAIVTKFGADAIRYHLLREIPFGQDGDFAEDALIRRYNDELANELGNLVSRLATLVEKKCGGKIPKAKPTELFSVDEWQRLCATVDNFELHRTLERVFHLIKQINKHLNDKEPWKMKDRAAIDAVVYTCIDALRIVCIPLAAFIPESCGKIRRVFGFSSPTAAGFVWGGTKSGLDVEKGSVLFPKIEVQKQSVFPMYLKVGKITHINPHPNGDKLYVLQVDVGQPIQLVAGIKLWYTPEQLLGHHVIVVSNLKHAKLRGIMSEGMLLAAEDERGVHLLTCDAPPGTAVSVSGYEINTAQITYEQFSEVALRVEKGKVFYDETPLRAANKSVSVSSADFAVIR